MTAISLPSSPNRTSPQPEVGLLRHSAFDAARGAWPGVELPFAEFVRYLEQLGHPGPPPQEASTLYLCAACALGRPNALASLERVFFPFVRAHIKRVIGADGELEDVLQNIRWRLFVGPNARIRGYRGDGSFSAWLRVIAVRAALDHRRARTACRRRDSRERLLDTSSTEAMNAPGLDELMFERYCRQLCQREFAAALASLRTEDRQLLLQHFVMGSSIDVLGALHTVHRATVARRIQRHLEHIRDHVQRRLTHELGSTSARELSTLFRSMVDFADSSVVTLLHPPAD